MCHCVHGQSIWLNRSRTQNDNYLCSSAAGLGGDSWYPLLDIRYLNSAPPTKPQNSLPYCSLCICGRLLDLVVYMRLGLWDTVGGALPLSFARSYHITGDFF